MHRRDFSRVLFASAAGSMAPSARAAETPNGRDHAQTPAEAAAKVSIADPSYEPGCVDRYGVNAEPGKTSMVQAFNAAIKQAHAGGAQVTYGSTFPCLLDAPVDCTFAGAGRQHGVVIRNLGPAGYGTYGILAKHRGVAVFDCTGSDVELHRVVIGTDPAVYPQTGVLWARNSDRGSVFCKMQYCGILGRFSVAPFYNYGAEEDSLIDCYFWNGASTPDTKVAVWTVNNIAGLHSIVPGLIATGRQSCIDHNCFGNQYQNAGGTSSSDCIYLEGGADSWKNFGGWAYSASSTAGGRALVYVDMTHGATNFALIQGLTGENGTHMQSHGIYFSDHQATPTGWKVDSCRFPNTVSAIEAGASTTLDNFHIVNISEPANHGLSAAGTVQNSVVHSPSMTIRIGNSRNNSLIGRT